MDTNTNMHENTEVQQQVTDQNSEQLMPEKAPNFPFLFRRFVEFLVVSLLTSIPFALIYHLGFRPTTSWAYRIIGVSLFGFIFINAYLLRAFYYSMGNRKVYFNVNLVAYAIYAALSIAVLLIFKDEELYSIYSYAFMPLKFVTLIFNDVLLTTSLKHQMVAAVMTHVLMYAVIFIAPLEMYSFDKPKSK